MDWILNNYFRLFLLSVFLIISYGCNKNQEILFLDDFNSTRLGPYSIAVGAHTEYHYLHEAAPRGKWEVSTFTWHTMLPWSVRANSEGENQMVCDVINDFSTYTHPMLCAGNRFWGDYDLSVNLDLESDEKMSGIIARYQNDRCYYIFCLDKGKVQIKYVHHARAYHEPYEEILAEAEHNLELGKDLTLQFSARGNKLSGKIGNILIEAQDDRYTLGRVGLVSDVPVEYNWVKVTSNRPEKEAFELRENEYKKEVQEAKAGVPGMVVWKKLDTKGFGVGRNLRFGDLDGDGELDVLITQVKRHGPGDANSEVGCMTAMTFDGERLWQIGNPDGANAELTNDVGVQIQDINNDGKNEVIYCKNLEIIVAEGRTGKTLYKAPTPRVTNKDPNERQNKFDRILGDCLFFCDLSGNGYDGDIIIKDRYKRVWALNSNLQMLWYNFLNTGHYPYAYDIDSDGKDELAIGYSLIDDDGSIMWTLDDQLRDHADGIAVVPYKTGADPVILCSASDEGIFFADKNGTIKKHHYLGHVQNPAVANFRDDLPGLETVSINFWGNQGILNFFNAEGDPYLSIEPNQYGSMCLPVNWTGNSEEFFVHNANVDEGGIYDGFGRRVLDFPHDGHPDMCNAVLDITGDCRDEIVVWDHYKIWVYSQNDNPKKGKLYRPERNSLSNYSNYQATVSLPGWQE